ncbi:MAG: OmpA family protein [Bacteroidetes bacterium]|nr:OmpA family protein [Bacteroidota bacterium]
MKLFKTYMVIVIAALLPAVVTIAQSPVAYVKEAQKSFAIGDYYNAAWYYTQAGNLDAAKVEYMYNAGLAYYNYNDYKNAGLMFEQAKADSSEAYPLATYYAAMCKMHMGLYETAKKYFAEFEPKAKYMEGYYQQKTKLALQSCEQLTNFPDNSRYVEVRNAGKNINSMYSDFGAVTINDTAMHYTSMRYSIDSENKNEKMYISKVMMSKGKPGSWKQSSAMDVNINAEDLGSSNMAISPDKSFAVFCKCRYDSTGSQICNLYQTQFKKGYQEASKIRGNVNSYQYTSTQPCIVQDGNGDYILYFASNRPGGYGKNDLWKSTISKEFKFSEPVNLGNAINTFEDEQSPWVSPQGELFFSSMGHPGFGGFDIYKSDVQTLAVPVNVGVPYNSGYHDLFYTQDNNDSTGMLTSNRPGSFSLKGETCCYDIYYYKKQKQEIIADKKNVKKAGNEIEKAVGFVFPLKLYFDNDYPDPHSLKIVSKRNYEELYKQYVGKQGEYVKNYSAAYPPIEQAEAAERINNFFDNDIKVSYEKLDKLCEYLEKKLENGKTLTIMVRGAASSLADEGYNYKLSQRRISSIKNYLMAYNNGALKQFFEGEQALKLEDDPRGETNALETPEKNDSKAFTIYSPQAAGSRYIEITEVTVE